MRVRVRRQPVMDQILLRSAGLDSGPPPPKGARDVPIAGRAASCGIGLFGPCPARRVIPAGRRERAVEDIGGSAGIRRISFPGPLETTNSRERGIRSSGLETLARKEI